jgi:hypothetical protein
VDYAPIRASRQQPGVAGAGAEQSRGDTPRL